MSNGTMSMWARDAIVRQIFRQETILTDCWVALTLGVAPTNATGSDLEEPPGSGYGRVQLPLGTANWGMTGYGEVYNLNDVTFGSPTADWGLVLGYALVTAGSGGEVIGSGAIVNPSRVTFSLNPVIAQQGIVIGLFD